MSENKPQFVDTNILIYAHDVTAGRKREVARRLVDELWHSGQGCLSTQVLQEFYVTITKKVKRPLAGHEAFSLVAEFATWRVHHFGIGDVLDAIVAHQRFNISYWDALVLRSASELGCEVLWSEDLNAGQEYGRVTVFNPFTMDAND